MCGGGGAPPVPPPDPAQVALQQEQLKLLQEQSQQQKAYSSVQAEQAGYKPIYGDDPAQVKLLDKIDEIRRRTGQDNPAEALPYLRQLEQTSFTGSRPGQVIVGYEKTDTRSVQDTALAKLQETQMATAQRANDALNKYLDSLDTEDYKNYQKAQQDLQAQQTQIAMEQGERTRRALKGELPLSEGTIQRKRSEFQLLKENLARGGNTIIGDDPSNAYSLTSPGSEALKEFNSRYASVEDQERRGALDSGTNAYLQAVGLSGNIGKSDLTTIGQLSNPGGYAASSNSFNPNISPVQNNLNLMGGYSSAMQPYMQMQQLQYDANRTGSQMDAANRAGWLQLGGTLGGAGIGGAAMLMSNRRFKKNIEPIKSEREATKALAKTPVYRWNYKSELDGHKKHLGTMTDEAPSDAVTEDGDHLDITSYLGLLTLSTKDLHHRVLSLEGSR